MKIIQHVCSRCSGLLWPLWHLDAYECQQGHRIYGVDLAFPERCAVYEGEGLAMTVRFLT